MKKEQMFMMIFRFSPDFSRQPSEEEKQAMKQSWGSFIGGIAISEKLVSTHQLGFEGKKIASDKSITDGISILDQQTLGGNMIVKANSLEEATAMAKECPIIQMGGTVEVRSIIPMES